MSDTITFTPYSVNPEESRYGVGEVFILEGRPWRITGIQPIVTPGLPTQWAVTMVPAYPRPVPSFAIIE